MAALARGKVTSHQDYWLVLPDFSVLGPRVPYLSLGMTLWGPDCDCPFFLKDGETEVWAGMATHS